MAVDLIYAATPAYGGWVTFTAHLFHCLRARGEKVRLFKVGARTESRYREFGYGVRYQIISSKCAESLNNPIITAIDKAHYGVLAGPLRGCRLVIHDPTELSAVVVGELPAFKVITIRATVKAFLAERHGTHSKLMLHPFYRYSTHKEPAEKRGAVSVSRVDFDKHTDIILRANELITTDEKIGIYGAVNTMYVYHKLRGLSFDGWYRGRFEKSFYDVGRVLNRARWVVDMSAIKGDGSGTQYTFLEAIHHGCVLVLNRRWFETAGATGSLQPGKNCFTVSDHMELAALINDPRDDLPCCVERSRLILNEHDLGVLPYG